MRIVVAAACFSIASCKAAPRSAPISQPTASAPASTSVDDLGPVLRPIRDANSLPGLAAAVMAGDRMIANGAVGVRKADDPTPVTTSDVWHLGSDTKAMTATLFALYVEAHRIRWTTTLAEAFPSWANEMDPAYRTVTFDMLMSHFGGAPADIPKDVWMAMWHPGDPRTERLAAAKAMLARPPETPPGTKFVYANAGYVIAGAALEELTNTAWEDLMRARLFTPLAMTTCGFGAPASDGAVDEPWGHSMKAGVPTPVAPHPRGDNPPSLGPAGTVHCSLADWGKFLAMHLAGARGESHFLSAASFDKLHAAWPGGSYAKGWIVATRSWGGGGDVLTHSGSNTMFYATVWIAPKLDRIFMVATNRADDVAAKAVDSTFGPLIAKYSR